QASGSSSYLLSVCFVNNYTGWAIGLNGTILATSNAGATFLESKGLYTPSEYELFQNFPNPFNPSTVIKFRIPKNSFVKIIVYDASGKKISELINQNMKAGEYEIPFFLNNYGKNGNSSGVYFYKIEANEYTCTKKMILLK
ncbi:MAG: T9SS type A sorting domain-containing protein, partial [Ignavibacteria bacterium]|nr:T9SS type A sorting domain-containing protein [Ignavibacteria bacterium]